MFFHWPEGMNNQSPTVNVLFSLKLSFLGGVYAIPVRNGKIQQIKDLRKGKLAAFRERVSHWLLAVSDFPGEEFLFCYASC